MLLNFCNYANMQCVAGYAPDAPDLSLITKQLPSHRNKNNPGAASVYGAAHYFMPAGAKVAARGSGDD
ncbi:hypothetical protein [Chitinophaga jiangningensis]|uniref:hypothetical protein n=1 Tax=Chitinophaga jiangningensis TaxID=1419482 RepID=UPI00116057C1|nr:hypothetical protein [Chitinophaga jiangningensis]